MIGWPTGCKDKIFTQVGHRNVLVLTPYQGEHRIMDGLPAWRNASRNSLVQTGRRDVAGSLIKPYPDSEP